MGLVVLGLLLLAVGSLASPSLSGTYRQYNPDENDVIIAVIDDDDDYHTTTTFTFGVNEFTIEAEFTIEFEDEEDDVWNVKYEYSRADATPHTQDAVDALETLAPRRDRLRLAAAPALCAACSAAATATTFSVKPMTASSWVLGLRARAKSAPPSSRSMNSRRLTPSRRRRRWHSRCSRCSLHWLRTLPSR